MPFLDAGPYIGAAIRSVMSQTYSDWELLLVDDGSSDGSVAIARELAASDDRIVLVAPDDARRGAASARNRGIAKARGSLIAFLDADDLYLPEKLARDVAALDANPTAALVYGATRWFHEGAAHRDWTERPGVRPDREYQPPYLLVRVIVEDRGDVPCTCGVMVRRAPLEAVGGFEQQFRLYEDQSLLAKVFLEYPVRVSSGCYSLYRQHDRSTSAAATARGEYSGNMPHDARRNFLVWLSGYARAKGASDAVMRSIERAMKDRGGLLSIVQRRLRRMARLAPF
jgi:glycosyltransferase involved in cell wall biosynthesis